MNFFIAGFTTISAFCKFTLSKAEELGAGCYLIMQYVKHLFGICFSIYPKR